MTDTEKELKQIKEVLATLISWIAQSAVGVLSIKDAEKLVAQLDK